ncbi:translation initiation factor IF-2-like [Falco rusticolus]|uniref:translation initiation factor IF-2-like n=1 Tax=Falco rusticolus TaxID=120794 RepID=UPI00188676D0|nr:translation initiation factor IF-2-like [Falco rusticolus]
MAPGCAASPLRQLSVLPSTAEENKGGRSARTAHLPLPTRRLRGPSAPRAAGEQHPVPPCSCRLTARPPSGTAPSAGGGAPAPSLSRVPSAGSGGGTHAWSTRPSASAVTQGRRGPRQRPLTAANGRRGGAGRGVRRGGRCRPRAAGRGRSTCAALSLAPQAEGPVVRARGPPSPPRSLRRWRRWRGGRRARRTGTPRRVVAAAAAAAAGAGRCRCRGSPTGWTCGSSSSSTWRYSSSSTCCPEGAGPRATT